MPSENLVRVGREATLLIHESSMSPEEEKLAREKAHSTSAQAIDVAKRCVFSLPPPSRGARAVYLACALL